MAVGSDLVQPRWYDGRTYATSWSGPNPDKVFTQSVQNSNFILRYLSMTLAAATSTANAGVVTSSGLGGAIVNTGPTPIAQTYAALCFVPLGFGDFIYLSAFTGVTLVWGGYYVPTIGFGTTPF